MSPWLTVVGIGEDGFKGLGSNARHALLQARQVFGSSRQLGSAAAVHSAPSVHWPSPFSCPGAGTAWRAGLRDWPAVIPCCSASARACRDRCLSSNAGDSRALLLFAGRGAPGLGVAGGGDVVGSRPPAGRAERPTGHGLRLLVLSNDGRARRRSRPALRARFGPSRMTVLEHLGGPALSDSVEGIASEWDALRSLH
jgi:precorrin-6Y C5,15-methyltransferase (decarboxylating)